MFAQDKWTRDRLTLTFGGRYDYLNARRLDEPAPAGRFVPAREAAAITCVPCWNDWSVRLGGAYDLFGTGKTALKASVGQVPRVAVAGASPKASNPIRSAIGHAHLDRSRRQRHGARSATGAAQYNEIGAERSTANFGLPAGADAFRCQDAAPDQLGRNRVGHAGDPAARRA